ncbi:MAG: RidA family protein [Polyangiaceae bacterium]
MQAKEIVSTERAPRAIGPYSQATKVGGFIFTSGQIGLDPGTGELVAGGFEAEARRVVANLIAILEAAGATPAAVVKTTVFLIDLGQFALMNAIYAEVFDSSLPARSTVQVTKLPKGAQVEIEAIAYVGEKQ